jgi:hypothetical protein
MKSRPTMPLARQCVNAARRRKTTADNSAVDKRTGIASGTKIPATDNGATPTWLRIQAERERAKQTRKDS